MVGKGKGALRESDRLPTSRAAEWTLEKCFREFLAISVKRQYEGDKRSVPLPFGVKTGETSVESCRIASLAQRLRCF